MTNFTDLALSPKVLRAVTDAGYETPTPIQAGAIPAALEGRDVLGIAQTGTGKTASFTLPMITALARGRARARMPRSLVLCPPFLIGCPHPIQVVQILFIGDLPQASPTAVFFEVAALTTCIFLVLEQGLAEVPDFFVVPDFLDGVLVDVSKGLLSLPWGLTTGSYRTILGNVKMDPRHHTKCLAPGNKIFVYLKGWVFA